ncbi:unnamed protein product [Lampetra fluviatilis]
MGGEEAGGPSISGDICLAPRRRVENTRHLLTRSTSPTDKKPKMWRSTASGRSLSPAEAEAAAASASSSSIASCVPSHNGRTTPP